MENKLVIAYWLSSRVVVGEAWRCFRYTRYTAMNLKRLRLSRTRPRYFDSTLQTIFVSN